MTQSPITITEDTSLDEVVHLMEVPPHQAAARGAQWEGRGYCQPANLLHALATASTNIPSNTPTDAAMRDQLMAELAKQPWSPPLMSQFVTVSWICRALFWLRTSVKPPSSQLKHSGRQGRSKPYCLGRARVGHGDL